MTGAEPRSEFAVEARGIRKRYGFREILRGVDLEVAAGRVFSLFGANGAGKSTLLKIIATRVRPTAGTLRVAGFDSRNDGTELRRTLGCVLHDHFLRLDLTLDENLRFYGELHGVAGCSGRARELAERFGLGARRNDPVRSFSQGMQKRATLARSLLHAPRVWLLDEPFSGLDIAGRALLESVIAERRAAGATVLLVTHDPESGLRLCDDAALLERGAVVARGKQAVAARLCAMGNPA